MPQQPQVAAPRSGWQRARAHDGTVLAWGLDVPQGAEPHAAPTVVLCNGIACSDDYWLDVAGALRDRLPVLRWDYRGHGRSDPPADPQAVDVQTLVTDLECVLDTAGVGDCLLVGHSFGVQICLEAALRAPERTRGVVAIAGAPGAPLPAGPGRAERVLRGLSRLAARGPRPAQSAWQALWTSPAVYWAGRLLRGTSGQTPRTVMDRYFSHVATLDLPTLLAMFSAMQAHSALERLGELKVPLIAMAGANDGLTPVRVLRAMALAAPLAELVVVPGGTHTLPAEAPDAVVAEVLRLVGHADAAGSAA